MMTIKLMTIIKADIPKNSDVLKQIENVVYNSLIEAALDALAPSSRPNKWWQFNDKGKSDKA